MQCNKSGLLPIIYFLLQMTGLIKGTNIDCNGKAFHCMNSTHFKICVDLGGGISKTVDEFLIPCPPFTYCKLTNYFECEYEVTTTFASINRQEEVMSDVTESTGVDNVLDVYPIIQLPYDNKEVEGVPTSHMLERLYNTVRTTYRYDTDKETPSEITTIPTFTAIKVSDLYNLNNQRDFNNLNNSKNIYDKSADSLINMPISTKFNNPLTTTEKAFHEIEPAYLNVAMKLGTDQPSLVEVVTFSSYSATESGNNNTLNITIAENSSTTINLNADDNKKNTSDDTQLYKMITNTHNITNASFAYNNGLEKKDYTSNILKVTMDLNKLNEDILTENIKQTIYLTDERNISINSPTETLTPKQYTTEKYKGQTLALSTDSKYKSDLETTIIFTSPEVAIPSNSEQNYYAENVNKIITTAIKDTTSATDTTSKFLTKIIVPKNTNNANFQTFPSTTEMTTVSFHLINNESSTSTLNQSKFFDVTISNMTKFTMHEIKKSNDSDGNKIAEYSANYSENPKYFTETQDATEKFMTFISKTTSPLIKDITIESRDLLDVDTNTPYLSTLEISTQINLDSAVTAVTDYKPIIISLNPIDNNSLRDIVGTEEMFTNLNTEKSNNHTNFQNISNIDKPFLRLNEDSSQATEIQAKMFMNEINETKDLVESTIDKFPNSTEIYKTIHTNYPMNNEKSSIMFTNEAQEPTDVSNQLISKNYLNKILHQNYVKQSELDPNAKLTSLNNHNSSFVTEQATSTMSEKNITEDIYDLYTSNNLHLDTENLIYDVKSRDTVRESSVSTTMQDITMELNNLHNPSTYVTHNFSGLEGSTEKPYVSALYRKSDSLSTITSQTYGTSEIKKLVNNSTKLILDFSKQNKIHLDKNETNIYLLEGATNKDFLSTSTKSYETDNHTAFSTRTLATSTENYKSRTENYPLHNNKNISTETSGDKEITEPNYKIAHIKKINGTTHLNPSVYQSILNPNKSSISQNLNSYNIDIEQTITPDMKNINIYKNNITAQNKSNFPDIKVNKNIKAEIIGVMSALQQNLFSITTSPLGDKSTKLSNVHTTNYILELEDNIKKYSEHAVTSGIDNFVTTTPKINVTSKDQEHINDATKSNYDYVSKDPIKLNSSSYFNLTESYKTQSYNNVMKNNEHSTMPNTYQNSDNKTNKIYHLNQKILYSETSQHTTIKSKKLSPPFPNIEFITSNTKDDKYELYDSATVINQPSVNFNEQNNDLKLASFKSDTFLETSTSSSNLYLPDSNSFDYDLGTTSNLKELIEDNVALYSTTEKELESNFNNVYEIIPSTETFKESEIKANKELSNTNDDMTTDSISTSLNLLTLNKNKTSTEHIYRETTSSFLTTKDKYSKSKIVHVTEDRNNELKLKEIANTTLDAKSNNQTYYKILNFSSITEHTLPTQEIYTLRVVSKGIKNHADFKSKDILRASHPYPYNTSIKQSSMSPEKPQDSVIPDMYILKKTNEQLAVKFGYENESKIPHSRLRPLNVTSVSNSQNSTTSPPSVHNQKINEKHTERLNLNPVGLNLQKKIQNATLLIINNKYLINTRDSKKQTTKMSINTPEFQLTGSPTQPVTKVTQSPMLGFRCLKHYRGKYSDRHNCRKYYVCAGDAQPHVGECPVNTVFSEIIKQCTKNLSHCIRNNKFKCLSSGRFYDVFSVNTYYICVSRKDGYIKFKFQCMNGYTLNKTSVRCIENYEDIHTSLSAPDSGSTSEGSKSNENSSERAVSNVFQCESLGKFANPNDCRKYYICSKNSKSEFRRKIKKCDSDEVWHREKRKCVDDDSYECKLT